MEFGSKLKALRKQKKFRMQDMADYLDIATSTYAGYEAEYRVPAADTLQKLAIKLDTSVDYLLGLTDNPGPPTKNVKEIMLKSKDLHWDGVMLNDKELKLIRDFLDMTFKNKNRDGKDGPIQNGNSH